MRKLVGNVLGAGVLLAGQAYAGLPGAVTDPVHAEAGLQQTTISFYANGTAVGGLLFPIGASVVSGAAANHTRGSGENADYTGNVEGSIKLAGGQSVVMFGDDVRVSTAAISPERAAAVHDLETMWLSDQALRGRAGANPLTPDEASRQTAIDVVNTRRLSEIIDRFGWPGVRFAGAASQGAFLVLQHADPATQRRYLPVLRDAVARHDALSVHLALLEDRVRVGMGEPQLYGTQLGGRPLHIEPIEDEAHVDERRSSIGMEPLADYAKSFGVVYTPQVAATVEQTNDGR